MLPVFPAGLNISFISMKSLKIMGSVCEEIKCEGIINQEHKLCVWSTIPNSDNAHSVRVRCGENIQMPL